jgi:hypothetical protein
MTESQQKVLELLPKMGERFPKVFTKESFVPFFWEVKLGDSKNVVANAGQVFDYGPALIVEACRLIALEQNRLLIDFGAEFVAHKLGVIKAEDKELNPPSAKYKPLDPFDRAAAAMECVLSLP